VRELPPGTTLDHLKGEARRWLKALRSSDAEAHARLRRAHPSAPPDATLRQVQHALAREYGHASWARLKIALAAPAAPDAMLTAILAAADAGDTARLTTLLDARPDLVSARGALSGHTGLRTALHFGVEREPVVRLLLARGADPNVRDEGDDAYPLHFAAEQQNLAVIRLLVEHGADTVGAGTHHLLNVLGWATAWDYVTADPAVVDYLLAHGARHDVFSATAVGDVAAIRAVVAAAPEDIRRVMDRTNRRRTALHLAIVKRQPAALRALLDLGPDLEAVDAAGFTPLDQAAMAGEIAMAEALLAAGAAMHLPAAVALGRTADVERALREQPGVLAPGAPWGTLIVRAAERAPGAVIETLVRHGASADAVDETDTSVDGTGGYSALHAAAWHGNTSAADALLRLRANPRVRDGRFHGTPAGWAAYANRPATRDRIMEADVDVFDVIAFGTPAQLEALLAADPGARDRPLADYSPGDEEGAFTPLTWAAERKRPEMAEVLRAHGAQDAPPP
jgi:ankyrin repeat protein